MMWIRALTLLSLIRMNRKARFLIGVKAESIGP